MPEISILQKGGLVMYLLAALSVYAVAVIIFKIIQFRKANIFDRSFIEPALREIKQGDRARATRVLSGIAGPIARIMRVTFECVANRDMSQKSKEAEILRVGSADIRYLEAHLRGLEMTASIAPLMGLLGTVIGMIGSFSKLSLSGTRVDPTMLAGGIWEALLTTAGGLAVAIPALAAHYILDGIIERVRATMKDVSVQILALEDEFRRNERLYAIEEAKRLETARKAQEEYEHQLRRQQEESERAARDEEDRRRRQEAEAERIARDEDERRRREDAEAWAEEQRRNAPQKTSTLHLLSPKYNNL